ncbi:hypothetical protein HYY74_06240 [Candidatus Woesearchaeota archaeon]|nr:hypothetical protein [Candidatus Woesearchaeota archaeon]
MIVPAEEIGKYLGKSVSELEGKVEKRTLGAFSWYGVYTQREFGRTAIDHLFILHHLEGRSLTQMAPEELGISVTTLSKIFAKYGLPILSRGERSRRAWEDRNINQRHADSIRKARLDPEKISKYHVRAISGERADMGYASSMWEANLARVFAYCGRQFTRGSVFRLQIPEGYRSIFNSDVTDMAVDFVVQDSRNRTTLYEIAASPLEGKVGYAKLELLAQQQPLRVVVITGKMYRRLKRRFEKAINSTPSFAGWETYKDNLKTNPDKYAPRRGE